MNKLNSIFENTRRAFTARFKSGCVLKGRRNFLIRPKKPDIYTFLEHFSRHFGKGVFLVQELILPKEEDYRVLAVGEQIIGSVCRRLVDESGITTNIAQEG